jgi:hypothetical protein
MGDKDWGIVVGVQVYPDLGDLCGPLNDAQAFTAWLTSPTGGGVPQEHTTEILSPNYQQRPKTATDAQPTVEAVEDALNRLDDLAQQNSQNGQGLHVGRRLYLYLAGHGFAPKLDEAALLMANATRIRLGYHFPGKLWADWFYRSGYFDEVLLFMDCCREDYPSAPLNFVPYRDVNDPDAVDRARHFYGFATKWSRNAREHAMQDGVVHGVFTAALLAGLNGGAAQPDGSITATSLSSFLYNNTKLFLSQADLTDADKATIQEPVCDFDTATAESFVIATAAVSKYPVTIHFPQAAVGKKASILGDKFAVVQATDAAPADWQVTLLRGLYLVDAGDGSQKTFEVTGTGAAIDVGF